MRTIEFMVFNAQRLVARIKKLQKYRLIAWILSNLRLSPNLFTVHILWLNKKIT
jgi:hypothetical protein